MLNRRHLLAAAAFTAAFPVLSAPAAEKRPFETAAFEAAQKAGRPILIDVFAPWCPTCRAQAPILSRLTREPRFKNLVFFQIDYDSQKDALRKLNARQQSTLIVFKGRKETGRSVGDTSEASIAGLLAKSL
jgi:thioredoxin 1